MVNIIMKKNIIVPAIFIIYFIFAILMNSVGIVILQVQTPFGVTASDASLLEGFKDLPLALVSFLVASYILSLGYKRVMLYALAAVGMVSLLATQIPEFWMIKVLFMVIGSCFALIKICVFSSIGLLTSNSREHSSLMNFLESFFMMGILSGYFLFSLFINDENPGDIRWLNIYYLLAGLCASSMLLVMLCPPIDSLVDVKAATDEDIRLIGMLRLCAVPLIGLFAISIFLYVLIEQSIMTWLPSFNHSVLNLPKSLSIQMASILAGATVVGRLLAGITLRYISWFRLLLFCIISAAALVLVVMPLANFTATDTVTSWSQAPLVAYIFPLIGLFLAPIYPIINSTILSALPRKKHPQMSGLIVVFSALGGTTGSIITGTLFENYDGVTAFYFSLVPMVLIVFTLLYFKKMVAHYE